MHAKPNEQTPHGIQMGNYGPAIAGLIEQAPCNELGRGHADQSRRQALAALTPQRVASPHALVDPDMASACLAGLWLRYDFLDESHEISQGIESTTGSFWHGIMHRREGDFANSKYWFRRVGSHPIFEPLATAARKLAHDSGQIRLGDHWDPFDFVDLCRQARGDSRLVPPVMQMQQCEWELLFDYCYRQATGTLSRFLGPTNSPEPPIESRLPPADSR